MAMLDDLHHLHERDVHDVLGAAERQIRYLGEPTIINYPTPSSPVYNVVVDGPCSAAELLLSWLPLTEPLEILAGYTVPGYADGQTLAVIGDAPSELRELLQKSGAQMVRCLPRGTHHGGFTILAELKTLAAVLERYELLPSKSIDELEKVQPFLEEAIKAWRATTPTADNLAKQLALEMIGTSPVIYSGPLLAPAARSWKTSFNRLAHNVAWQGTYPAVRLTDVPGWRSHPIDKIYSVVDLSSSFESPHIDTQMQAAERALSGKRPAANKIAAVGQTKLQQLLWTIVLGNFVAAYTAILNGISPRIEVT